MIKKKLYRLKNFLKGNEWYYKYDIKVNKIAVGDVGYEWVLCPDLLKEGSIVYSFGAGTDISFDKDLVKRFGLNVYLFDPTPKSVKYVKEQNLSSNFIFEEIGIADFSGNAKFYLPLNPDFVSATIERQSEMQKNIEVRVECLSDIMKRHQHIFIDLLKMDIEGAEYNVIDDILNSRIEIQQILIEFHHRFANAGISKTRNSLKKLRAAGYALFHVSETGEEFSFIKIKDS